MNDTDETWGLPFAPEDLEDAYAYCRAAGLPMEISDEHEGACEVIHIDPRDTGFDAPSFSIHQDVEKPDQYAVSEGEARRYFQDIISALNFIQAQRGADWPID
jgi:hypothetical protein